LTSREVTPEKGREGSPVMKKEKLWGHKTSLKKRGTPAADWVVDPVPKGNGPTNRVERKDTRYRKRRWFTTELRRKPYREGEGYVSKGRPRADSQWGKKKLD